MSDSPFTKGKKDRKGKLNRFETILEKELAQIEETKAMDRIFASAAGQCERKVAGLYFLVEGASRARKASAEFYFKTGSLFEEIVSVAFHKADIYLDSETRVEAYHPEIPLSGRIDFTIRDPANLDEIVLVELKSCGKLPERPKPGQLAQLMTYLTVTGMPKGILWYISRNVADWGGDLLQRAFIIEPTEREKWQTIFRTALGAVHARDGFLPPLPDHMKKYKCGFCSLTDFCWGGDTSLLEGYELPNPKQADRLWAEATAIADDFIERQDELAAQYRELMLEAV